MQTRALGTTGITVSALGLGTVKLGRTRGLKHPTPARIPTDDEARALLALARDRGITLLDTAPAYGSSEERLGALLAGERGRWTICTKVGEEFDEATGQSRFDFTPEGVRASVRRSLQRLRTDVLDVVLVHSDGAAELRLEELGTLDALRDLRRAGALRAVGVSTKTVEGALRAVAACDVVMLTLHPGATDDLPAIEAARARGVGVLIKKALASGHAAAGGAGGPSAPPGEAPALDPVGVSLAFALRTPGVSSVIVGTTSPTHLKHNCDAADAAAG